MNQRRQELLCSQSETLLKLLEQNTELTRITRELTGRIEAVTAEVHDRLVVDRR